MLRRTPIAAFVEPKDIGIKILNVQLMLEREDLQSQRRKTNQLARLPSPTKLHLFTTSRAWSHRDFFPSATSYGNMFTVGMVQHCISDKPCDDVHAMHEVTINGPPESFAGYLVLDTGCQRTCCGTFENTTTLFPK